MQADQRLEEEAVGDREGVPAQGADAGGQPEDLGDLGLGVGTHPPQRVVDIAGLERGTAVGDGGAVDGVAVRVGGPRPQQDHEGQGEGGRGQQQDGHD